MKILWQRCKKYWDAAHTNIMDPSQIPLRDLHLPPEIIWWPLAPGWWVLLALFAMGLVWLLYKSAMRWRAGKSRRAALRALAILDKEYRADGNTDRFAKQLSELLRRGMLAYAPRAEVAGLTGERWLQWLDKGMAENVFTQGPGQALESLPYRNPELGDEGVDVEGLIDAVRRRLQTPLAESTS
jgi:hypothetical protein